MVDMESSSHAMPRPEMPAAVERWEVAGGTWRIARVDDSGADVDLLRCDGGEVVEILHLTEPEDIRWANTQ